MLRNMAGAATALTLTLAALAGPAAAADLAVLLGSGNYDDLRDVRDGDAVLAAVPALEDAGVDVLTQGDATADELDEMVASIEQMAPSADRLLVVLSGRFVHSGVETYFLPTDLSEQRLGRVADDGLALSTLLAVMAELPEKAVLVLASDGRDREAGPFLAAGPGTPDLPEGVTLVSGAPRQAAALVRDTLAVPGARLKAAVAADGSLALSGYGPDRYAFLPAPGSLGTDALDDAYWAVATDLDSQDGYDAYLSRYPEGRHVGDARARLKVLAQANDPVAIAQRAETALKLTQAERQQVQRDLTSLGLDTRGVDGIFGPGSRRAIAAWQERNGYDSTSYVTRAQINALADQAEKRRAQQAAQRAQADRAFWRDTGSVGTEAGLRAYLEKFPDGQYADAAKRELEVFDRRAAEEREAQDRADWSRAQASDTVEGYRAYLDAHAKGIFAEDARAIVARRTAPTEGAAEEDALALNTLSRRLMEERLQALGFNPGTVDGNFDAQTRAALRSYQQQAGLPATGYASEGLVVRLLADSLRGVLQ